ncbi:MAG: flagellar biosynthesis protein FlhF [Oligoflexia bacterium]|nr:flagellar biosynthesis protein FlhF [Oligoflexia bacterium]
MQVKKFEAPTIQEALDTIKRELGPEAIILQTRKNRRGFGLMSKESVEVTAAVSDRSIQKKKFAENRLPEANREGARRLPAERQADLYDKVLDKHLERAAATRDRVEVGKPVPQKRLTATRYIDIADEGATAGGAPRSRGPGASAAGSAPATVSGVAARASGAADGPGTGAMKAPLGPSPDLSVNEELRHLKRMVEELKSAQEGAGAQGAEALLGNGALANPALQSAFEQLVLNGIDRRYAFALIKAAGFELGPEASRNPERVVDQVAAEIMRGTEVLSVLAGIEPAAQAQGRQGPVTLALIGPTGVGKTTTVAKIASEALLKRNLKVGLINLDSYKVAAFDHLGTYGKILNVPFRSVASAEELRAAMMDFQALDLVLVDTTGRSQRDPESLKEMQAILQAVPGIRTQLVLSVTTRDAELYDMAGRFSMFRPQGIIMSKLDEATIFGSVYNVSRRMKLPLMYFTVGQRVPEDIEEATRERVAALILDL